MSQTTVAETFWFLDLKPLKYFSSMKKKCISAMPNCIIVDLEDFKIGMIVDFKNGWTARKFERQVF